MFTDAALNAREFLTEVEGLTLQLQREIDAHRMALPATPEAIAERRRRVLAGDFRFFAYTYFPHRIRGEPSTFQAFFCQRFPQLLARADGGREWFKAPRGEAKSSLATKIGPVYVATLALLQREAIRAETGLDAPPVFIDYVMILGAEARLPAKLIEVVKTELTSNASLALDFPEVCGSTSTWKIGETCRRRSGR